MWTLTNGISKVQTFVKQEPQIYTAGSLKLQLKAKHGDS